MHSIRVHVLQHAPFEGAAKIADWAEARGHRLTRTRLDLSEPLPEPAAFDLLVVMGGAMNVYQYRDHPWLRAERELVAASIAQNRAILGVCLGAQLLADALGARVVQNRVKEIGWFPVHVLKGASDLFGQFPSECPVFHWHGDTFELPAGAVCVAESEGCKNQAFVVGDRLVGLQFHVEISRETIPGFIAGGDDELVAERYVQTADEILSGVPDLAPIHDALYSLLDGLAARISP